MSRLLRVPHEGLREGEAELSEQALHYATRVHRLRSGDRLTLFDAGAGLEAEVELVDERTGRVRIAACRAVRSITLPVTLISALGKGDKPEQVVRDATVFGAARVVLAVSERSVARATGADRNQRFERVAIETARQCGRGDVPAIEGPLDLGAYLAQPTGAVALRLVAARAADSRPLLSVIREAWQKARELPPIDVLIGPEGGLSPREIDGARAHGFVPVGLGPFVLRTEAASGAVLAALALHADTLRAH